MSTSPPSINHRGIKNINKNNDSLLPNSFQLMNAYPNPFNPTTTIQFNLDRMKNVNLSILDINGKIVETLIIGTVQLGQHKLQWNPKSKPTGIYFI
ncbi:MAG: T9SS type A sorting domain-containing protein [Candidatus Marinimicrobia bacterium]|jgi:hypothetical protein|nr:T9SS type A sorting domain-containing protein [Candidatus Neomarinimicrobiota bacterium]MBT3937509.1 T9SS type A sorting domain-containing protein [Candidatus Neomarinimicrobiota bacterium]MBT3961159.1 T9SS type A sorting domain-containing protein [Candidatus Neomarinimicrobiota bacterium]MBT4384042.1 T9SS type A sorting domain-containing protein [Candidatus Neomarinimicrobiota bacterium]MBT4636997.1 T9SS type A sorting domain-containing protein [Candidatus Neomarinimicrobiota bacterium]